MQKRFILTIGMALAIAFLTANVEAKRGHASKATPQPQPRRQQVPPPQQVEPAPATNQPSAGSAVSQDLAAMEVAEHKVKTTFEASPDWAAAQEAFHTASAAYSAARKACIDKLKSNPGYLDASQKSEKASTDLSALRNNSQSSSDDIAAGATTAFAAKTKMSQLEKDAFVSDPAVAEAKTNLDTAAAGIAKLREQEHAAVLADADYQAAKQKYDAAKGSKPAT